MYFYFKSGWKEVMLNKLNSFNINYCHNYCMVVKTYGDQSELLTGETFTLHFEI